MGAGARAAVCAVLVWGFLAAAAAAQARWIQIEAQRTEAAAIDRARAWAGAFPEVTAHALASGWFGIVLGPFPAEDAALRFGLLREDRLIPGDSFLTDGRVFRARVWPEAGPNPAPVPGAAAPPPAGTLAAAPGETLAAARADEAALSRAQREDVQRALAHAGHYTAAVNGIFGPRTRSAIGAWQRAEGFEATEVLTPSQRTRLLEAWRSAEAAIGLVRVTEAEAGIEIDLPLGLVAFQGYEPPFVHFAPRAGSGWRVILISQPGDPGALAALYDLLAGGGILPAEGPREPGPRSFEIRGSDPRAEAWAWAELAGGLIKGFVLTGPAADAARLARVEAAMRAGFRAVGGRALDPALAPIDPAVRAEMMTGLAPRQPLRLRSGVWADADGAVLTTAEAVAGCASVTIEGAIAADVVLTDAASGVALLRPRAALAPARVAAAGPLPRAGADVAVAGYPFGAALAAPVVTFGTIAAAPEGSAAGPRWLRIAALAGDAGGPVLDATGALVGLLLPAPAADGRVLPPGVATMAPVEAFAPALAANGLTLAAAARGGALPPEDVTKAGRALAVQVSCWE